MKRTLFCIFVVLSWLAIPSTIRAQTLETTVCDILSNPQSFDGKIVRIKGVAIARFEEFAIRGTDCNQVVNAIWLAYPEGARGKAGPAASLRLQLANNNPIVVSNLSRVPVTLEKNKDFKDFDKLLSTRAKTDGMCLGCVKFTIAGTFVGRLDGTKNAGLSRDGGGKIIGLSGFGNLNRYTARLVLQSVSDISAQEIDYAKGGVSPSARGDRSESGAFVPVSPTADQLKRAAAAFGAPGEDNGVSVGFGVANESRKDETAKPNSNSPDGLLFDVTFDGDRLKGPAMGIAMSHEGTHIADIRDPASGTQNLSFYGAEFRAWQTSVLSAVTNKLKILTLPAGYVIYNQSWSNADIGKNANSGISGFVVNWSSITNLPTR